MKKILLLSAVLAIAIMGCGSGDKAGTDAAGGTSAAAVVSLKDKVVGIWKFDVESASGKMITEEVKKSPQWTTMKEGMAKASLELKADGSYVGTGPDGKPESGKWSLDGNTLKMDPEKAEDKTNQPKVTINADGTKMHFAAPDGSMEMDLVKG